MWKYISQTNWLHTARKMIKWFCLWEWYICFLACFLCEQNHVWFQGRSLSCYNCWYACFFSWEHLSYHHSPGPFYHWQISSQSQAISDPTCYWPIKLLTHSIRTTQSLTHPIPDLAHIWPIPLANHWHILSLTHLNTDPLHHRPIPHDSLGL